MSTIGAIFQAIAEFFGFINRRTDLKNQADVKQAAKAQNAVNTRNEIENSVAGKDVAGTRDDLAE